MIRDGARYPAIALWNEYVGTKFNGDVTQMWATKGALMLAKCAEALALRKAFPQDLSGLYTSDEMQQADNGQQGSTRQRPQQSTQARPRSITEALGEPSVDVDSLLAAIEAAESKDVLRELWKQTATLPAQEKDDIQALIMGRIQGMSEPESDGASLPELSSCRWTLSLLTRRRWKSRWRHEPLLPRYVHVQWSGAGMEPARSLVRHS